MRVLNPKQRLFCLEYLKDFNATKAAIRAGYSEKSAYSQAHDLLKNHEVKEMIEEHSREHYRVLGLGVQRIISELATMAFSEEVRHTDKIKALEALMKHELSQREDTKHHLSGSAQRIIEALSKMKGK